MRELASALVGVDTHEDPRLMSPELVLVADAEDTEAARAQLARPQWSTPPRAPEHAPERSARPKHWKLGLVALVVVALGATGYVGATHWRHTAPRGNAFVPARTWAWAPAAGAKAYEATFFRGSQIVFRGRVTQPRVVLPRSFRFEAGSYRWTVRALPPATGAPPLVDSTFALTAAGAAAANDASR